MNLSVKTLGVFWGAVYASAFILFGALLLSPAGTQEKKPDEFKRGRGRVQPHPEVIAKRHTNSLARHGHRIGKLPKVTADKFDCRTAPGFVVLPVDDQGNCGSCYGVSVVGVVSAALARNGLVPSGEAGRLSNQFGLDCGAFEGGCNGGDEAQVFAYMKTHGFPLQSEYGPYRERSGQCKATADLLKRYKPLDWGYCTPAQESGIANTQDIKNCMARYGPISIAFDAGGCNSYQAGQVMTGNGGNVDHAVALIGWDDSKGTKGAWLMQNQWGTSWGDGGLCWIAYGAWSVGTEAIWCSAGDPTPPAPPTPPVPPMPPVPPGPGPAPGPAPGSYLFLDKGFPAGSMLRVAGPGEEICPAGSTAKLAAFQQFIDLFTKK